MISKRVLIKWRKEALAKAADLDKIIDGSMYVNTTYQAKQIEKILVLTQELIDQHLLKEEEGRKSGN